MADVLFNNLSFLDSSTSPIEKSQTSFLKLNNYLANKRSGSICKRGGSAYQYVNGDIYGLSSYSVKNVLSISSNNSIPIRCIWDGANYRVEKYSWETDEWAEIAANATNYLDFDYGSVATIVQVSDMLAIAANRIAKVIDPTSGKVTRLGGSAPAAAPTVTKTGTGITGTVAYAYTFYDSTTGWESSPSPITAFTTCADEGIIVGGLGTTIDREGIDKKRIYRTEISGDFPLLYLAEVALATAGFADDGSLYLGDNMPDIGDHEPPQDGVYILEKHEDRLFYAYQAAVYYSHIFAGVYPNLEYFSDARSFNFPFTVKAIKSVPKLGGLLIFGAPGMGIKLLTGTSEADFELKDYLPTEGTNFHHSVTAKDDKVVFWGTRTPRMIADGNIVEDFGQGFSNYLDEYTNAEFTTSMYIWSLYHQDSGQFIFGIAGENADLIACEDGNINIIECIDEYGNLVWVDGA